MYTFILFYPQPLRSVSVLFSATASGWGAGDGKKFVCAISQKPEGVGNLNLVGTLVGWCRCATSWYDLDLTFDLAVVTLILKILSGPYFRNCKV